MMRPPPIPTPTAPLVHYTTLFRSLESPTGYVYPAPTMVSNLKSVPTNTPLPELPPPPEWMKQSACLNETDLFDTFYDGDTRDGPNLRAARRICGGCRSEEHTSELQSLMRI